ncbi:MAG: hypothetical protein Aurels2KO_34260 [Aureliella sp.]
MKKVLTVAKNEYLIAVTSKAFLIGVVMMPFFMCGAFVVRHFTKDQVDVTPRKLAIVDRTGKLYEQLESLATNRNESEIYKDTDSGERIQTAAEFLLEEVVDQPETSGATEDKSTSAPDSLEVQLSERVSSGDLFAFAIIDEDLLVPGSSATVHYHSNTPTYQTQSNWLRACVDALVRQYRIEELNIAPEAVTALASPVTLEQRGLASKQADGEIGEAPKQDRLMTFAVPFGGMMLMFVMVMSVAPAMLNNVLEEKMQKISEFLVSSISPFQLMLGKLLGAVSVGLTLSCIYIGAVYTVTVYYDMADKVPLHLYAWFVFYLLIALTIFGSIFSAIGAACSEIRDAQSLMTPVMLMVVLPMMCLGAVLDSPSSMFSRAVSLFPPATPMLMFTRMAIPPGPAAWEVILGTVLAVGFALFCVWAAGKIFRIAILSQGQAPTLAKLVTWIFTK